jgi:acetyl-CoA carboxylase biotin carboxyl carrier protein
LKLGTDLLRELMSLLESSGLSEMEIETKDFRVYLSKPKAQAPAQVIASPAAAPVDAPAAALGPRVEPVEKPEAEPAEEIPPGLHAVRSPIVGTFYRAPAPGAEPFTDTGKKVHKGQALCIVEAMKVMNEIESDVDGEVVEVLVENAQPVEYGQAMFLLKPG